MTRGLARLALLAVLATAGCAGPGEARDAGSQDEGGAAMSGKPIILGAASTRIELAVPSSLSAARGRGEAVRLTLSGLKTDAQPGTLYRVQLGDGPPLGHINFYNVATGGEASFSFDAGPALDRLAPGAPVVVTLTPEGAPDPAAHPVVGTAVLAPVEGN